LLGGYKFSKAEKILFLIIFMLEKSTVQMKFTQYFLLTRERDDRKDIKLEWIEFVFYHPVLEVVQSDTN